MRLLPVLGLSCLAFAPLVPALDEERRFVEALSENGFPDLAHIILDRIKHHATHAVPDEEALRIRIRISQGDFAFAEARLQEMGGAAELWLLLAETAAARNETAYALRAYPRYMESVLVADEVSLRAAFTYGTLLEKQDHAEAAEKLYERMLALPAEPESTRGGAPARAAGLTRPLKLNLARLLVSERGTCAKRLERAVRLCEEVQLGGIDLWFGEAVVLWSRVLEQREAWEELEQVLETQLELLYDMEQSLQRQLGAIEQISPLAGARFLLGRAYEQSGRIADALHQYCNVYARYGESRWGPPAQERARDLIRHLEEQGHSVQIDAGAQASRMKQSAFQVARRLKADRRHAEAVPEYLAALTRYPEGEGTGEALRGLLLCYIHLADSLKAEVVADYASERFADDPEVVSSLMTAAQTAMERELGETAWRLYDLYLDRFPDDARMPAVLLRLASLRRQSGETAAEEALLQRIITERPEGPQAVRAQGQLAWNAFVRNDLNTAVSRFHAYIERETDPDRRMPALFALAEALRLSSPGRPAEAFEQYRRLEEEILRLDQTRGAPDEQRAAARAHLENTVFYQGLCLVAAGRTEEAVDELMRFAALYPESNRLARNRLALGLALVELGRHGEAVDIFAQIRAEDGSDLYEPALFHRGNALVETSRFAEAAGVLSELLHVRPDTAFYFEAALLQGRALTAAGQAEEAVRVLNDLMRVAADDLLLHRAGLELGRAQKDPVQKLASFQRVALLADPDDPAQAKLIAEALRESLPLYLALNRPQDALADSERLLNEFKSLGHSAELVAFHRSVRESLSLEPVHHE